MLTTLRSKTGGWIAKIFIGLLAASFAVWGIEDMLRGRVSDELARVESASSPPPSTANSSTSNCGCTLSG
jgi:hypothetical protein